MLCENELCVYQENGECILEEISIDAIGNCTECTLVDINNEILKQAKQKFIKEHYNS